MWSTLYRAATEMLLKSQRTTEFIHLRNSYSVAVVTLYIQNDDCTCANTLTKIKIIHQYKPNVTEWCCTIGSNAPPLIGWVLFDVVFLYVYKYEYHWEEKKKMYEDKSVALGSVSK